MRKESSMIDLRPPTEETTYIEEPTHEYYKSQRMSFTHLESKFFSSFPAIVKLL